jgi:UDP-glucose 4-epimerase
MAKYVITGGAGFIGSTLGLELAAEGHDVVWIDDLSFGCLDNMTVNGKIAAPFIKGDVCTLDLRPIFEGTDAVFHFAGISPLPVCQCQPGRAFDVNVGGTAKVLEACRQVGVAKIVFASTSAIYENNKTFPCQEDDAVAPTLVYAQTKLAAERLCRAFVDVYGMNISMTRYYNVYGPHQDVRRKSPPFTGYVIRELLAGRQPVLHSDGKQSRDYVHVADVNRLNRLCTTHPAAKGQVFNVASGKSYSVAELYGIIADIVGSDVKPVYRSARDFWDAYPELYNAAFPLSRDRLAAEVNKFSLGSTEKAASLIGWRAEIGIAEGLRQTVAGCREILAA